MRFIRLISILIILWTTVSWAEILSSDRIVTWQGNVGVTGGIPTYPCSTTIAANSSASTVNNALSNAATNTAVCLQAGSGTWTSAVVVPSNKVLRGTKDANGVPTTLISSSNSWPYFIRVGGTPGWSDPSVCVALSSNAVKGQSSVQTATKPACLSVGNILYLSELDDGGAGLVNNDGDEGVGTHYDAGRSLGHLVKITSVTGSSNPYTVNFELPVAYDFKTARTAQLKSVGNNWGSYAGLEDIQITGTNHTAEWNASSIEMGFSSNCWVKNVKVISGAGGAGVMLYTSYRNEVRDSWFDDSYYSSAGLGYGASLYYYSTANLIENNIWRRYHVGAFVNYGGAYNVIGYNYIREGVASSGGYGPMGTHGSHTYMTLYEGNYATEGPVGFDFTHGSGSHQTVFRNKILGVNVSNQSAIALQAWNRDMNIVGNILGTTGVHGGYKNTCTSGGAESPIFLLGYSATLPCDDLVETFDITHIIVHGNYAYCTSGTGCNTQSWDSGIADHSIPNSYYLASAPSNSWWCSQSIFPPVNPNGPIVSDIPAKRRYDGATCTLNSPIPQTVQGVAIVGTFQ